MEKLFSKLIITIFVLILSPKIVAGDNLENTSVYSVYTLSDKTTAIVSNMSDSDEIFSQFDEIFIRVDESEKFKESFFDFIYDKKTSTHITPYDTTGIFSLLHNRKLEDKIKPLMSREFYIYGTKGIEIRSVRDIVFGLDECMTNIYAFVIDHFDREKNGHPLIATDKKLDIVYHEDFTNIEEKINTFYNSFENDYSDDIPTKVFARIGSLYFTYTDDFEWNKKSDDDKNCFFPARGIFRLKQDSSIVPVWEDELDLYGIPCD